MADGVHERRADWAAVESVGPVLREQPVRSCEVRVLQHRADRGRLAVPQEERATT